MERDRLSHETRPADPRTFVLEQQRQGLDLEQRFAEVLSRPDDAPARRGLAGALKGLATLLEPQYFVSPPPSIDVPGRVAENLRLIQHQSGFPSQTRLERLAATLAESEPLPEEDLVLLESLHQLVEEEAVRGALAMFGVA